MTSPGPYRESPDEPALGQLDLLVVADSVEGGLGAAAEAHARWFAARGWNVALASVDVQADQLGGALTLELPVPGTAFDLRSVLRAARVLRLVLRRQRPAIVHAHGTRSQLLCLLAGSKPFVTLHGAGRLETQGPVSTVVRRAARRIAPLLSRGAYSAAPQPGWRTVLQASPRLAQLDRLPASLDRPPAFVWVGRLDRPKRPDLFVDAVHRAAASTPLRGVVVGDGPLRTETEDRAAALGAPVEFAGLREDVNAFLADARAVCLFSDFEGVPFSVQEAMWAARPVVVSDLPTLRWFAGEAAVFASDADSAATAMLALCDDEAASRAGQASAERARSLLSPEAPYPELEREYGHRPSRRP